MSIRLIVSDWIEGMRGLPDASVQMIGPTSPPYLGLRSYGTAALIRGGDPDHSHVWQAVPSTGARSSDTNPGPLQHPGNKNREMLTADMCVCGAWRGELGSEPTPEMFIEHLVEGFREAARILRPDGILVVNLADSYHNARTGGMPGQSLHAGDQRAKPTEQAAHRRRMSGIPQKSLFLIPERFVLAMQQDGWIVRSRIPWLKRNPMPESVSDRPASAVEYLFLFSKSRNYFWDSAAIRQGMPRVVQQSNRSGKGFILGQNFRPGTPPSTGAWSPARIDDRRLRIYDAVHHASTLFQGSQLQSQIGLSALDPEIRQQLTEDAGRILVTGSPIVYGASVGDTGLREADCAAEQFLQKLKGLGVALGNGNDFGERRGSSESLQAPRFGGDRDATIGVDNAGEVSEEEFVFHNKKYTPQDTTSSEISGRAYRNSDAFFESAGDLIPDDWQGLMLDEGGDPLALVVNSQPRKGSHYARFPNALVEPFVKAGTSAKGCCPACGAPWRRMVERGALVQTGHHAVAPPKYAGAADFLGRGKGQAAFVSGLQPGMAYTKTTLGWEPGCACDAGSPVPCTILDPFAGGGTSLVVADRLGRDAIGIELNENYARDAVRELEGDAGFFADVGVTA